MGAVAKTQTEDAPSGRGLDARDTAALVSRARSGDRRAFAALYRRHGRMVHGVLLARLPRTELRDAMQEVFTSALAKLDGLRDPSRFGPWLATIARNCARDWFKRHANTRELAHEPGALDDRRAAHPGPDLADTLTLLAGLQGLPEDYRELLLLRFAEGMTGPEIAAQIGMTPGSVRVKLHRGVALLRAQLEAADAAETKDSHD